MNVSMHKAVRVRFMGEEYVWLRCKNNTGALAYPHHVDSDGHIRDALTALCAYSFAHVYKDGYIRRYGAVIGTVADLEELE